MTITADDPGTFPIRCAEYCGNQHSMMIGQVKIVAAEAQTVPLIPASKER